MANRWFARMSTKAGPWFYRKLGGDPYARRHDILVILLTTPGRKSGLPRSTCVRALETPDGYLVWGTGSGSREDPDWFRNLRAVTATDVQLLKEKFRANVRELTGAERDETWQNVILAQAPAVEKYATKAGRTIPVALLTRA